LSNSLISIKHGKTSYHYGGLDIVPLGWKIYLRSKKFDEMSILSEDGIWKTTLAEFLAYPVSCSQKDVLKFLAMKLDDLIQESEFMKKHKIYFRRMVAQRFLSFSNHFTTTIINIIITICIN